MSTVTSDLSGQDLVARIEVAADRGELDEGDGAFWVETAEGALIVIENVDASELQDALSALAVGSQMRLRERATRLKRGTVSASSS